MCTNHAMDSHEDLNARVPVFGPRSESPLEIPCGEIHFTPAQRGGEVLQEETCRGHSRDSKWGRLRKLTRSRRWREPGCWWPAGVLPHPAPPPAKWPSQGRPRQAGCPPLPHPTCAPLPAPATEARPAQVAMIVDRRHSTPAEKAPGPQPTHARLPGSHPFRAECPSAFCHPRALGASGDAFMAPLAQLLKAPRGPTIGSNRRPGFVTLVLGASSRASPLWSAGSSCPPLPRHALCVLQPLVRPSLFDPEAVT